jgi:Ca-activated chloride channel family protein
MIRFAHSEYLILLAVLPILLALFSWSWRRRRILLERFGAEKMIAQLIPSTSAYKQPVKFFILWIALALLILGVANPQIGTKLEEVKREGVDIMIALDVSNSMKAEDIRPNRLESAKQEISNMIEKFQNDRIGIIVFAGESYLQLPLTMDYSSARLILSAIDVDIVPIPGTAIGSAVKLAMKSFAAGEKKHKVIVIISDGENHEDDAIAAAKEAHDDGVIVHTVGMGSPEGVPIPLYQNNVLAGYRKDGDGQTVVTKLDEQTLRQIAEAGGGVFVRATNQEDELDVILKQVEAMEKKEFGAKIFTEYEDRFQYMLAIGLVLLLIDVFISERKNELFSRWNFLKSK